MKFVLRIAPIALLILPTVVFAAVPNTLKDLVGMLVNLLNTATGVLVAAALVAFLYGAAYNMLKAGERGSGALREFLVWGVIILFVMVSIWGILNLLQQTLFGTGTGSSSSGGTAMPAQTNGSAQPGSNIQFN
jgi:hypothetical protein